MPQASDFQFDTSKLADRYCTDMDSYVSNTPNKFQLSSSKPDWSNFLKEGI